MDDTEYRTIQVKAWNNAEIIIKSMSAKEKLDWVKSVEKKNNELNAALELIIICCVGDDHKPLFEKHDLEALQHKSAEALNFISGECLKMCGLHSDAIEEEAKN